MNTLITMIFICFGGYLLGTEVFIYDHSDILVTMFFINSMDTYLLLRYLLKLYTSTVITSVPSTPLAMGHSKVYKFKS